MKMFNLKKKSKSKGFTLIEILLVVGFIALAGIGVYVVYNKVQTSNAANTEVRNLDTIRAGVKNIYAGSTNYATITEEVLLNAKVIPDNMMVSAAGTGPTATPAGVRSSFGGGVTVRPASFGAGTPPANNAFAITYTGVPTDICSKFVTIGGNSFNSVTVGGTSVKNTSATATTNLDVARTAERCGSAATVDVVFTSL